MILDYVSVGLGGACGAVCRYLIGMLTVSMFGPFFPVGTLVVNLLGSFIIGFLSIFFVGRVSGHNYLNLFSMVGFLGGLTTFSDLSLQTFELYAVHDWLYATLNIVLNCVLGIGLLVYGAHVAKPLQAVGEIRISK